MNARGEEYYTRASNKMLSASGLEDFTGAMEWFEQIRGYKDSEQKIDECKEKIEECKKKIEGIEKEALERWLKFCIVSGVIIVFAIIAVILTFHIQSRIEDKQAEEMYMQADEYEEKGDIVQARLYYCKAGDYKDSVEKFLKLSANTVLSGAYHMVGLKSDGTLVVVGNVPKGVKKWKDIRVPSH